MDLGLRHKNYLREMNMLVAKAENRRFDPKKRERCQQRLNDLKNRLIPQLQEQLALPG